LDGANPWVPDDPDKYGPHGYVTLEVTGRKITERVHDPNGADLLDGELEAIA
jgi:hypothetical protein